MDRFMDFLEYAGKSDKDHLIKIPPFSLVVEVSDYISDLEATLAGYCEGEFFADTIVMKYDSDFQVSERRLMVSWVPEMGILGITEPVCEHFDKEVERLVVPLMQFVPLGPCYISKKDKILFTKTYFVIATRSLGQRGFYFVAFCQAITISPNAYISEKFNKNLIHSTKSNFRDKCPFFMRGIVFGPTLFGFSAEQSLDSENYVKIFPIVKYDGNLVRTFLQILNPTNRLLSPYLIFWCKDESEFPAMCAEHVADFDECKELLNSEFNGFLDRMEVDYVCDGW